MADTTIWFLLIDHKCMPIGNADRVTVPLTHDVVDLRHKIKEKSPVDLVHVEARRLRVFECTDSSTNLLEDDDGETLPNKLNKIFSNKLVKELSSTRTMAQLLNTNKTLIVQMPDVQQKVRKRDDDDDDDDGCPRKLKHLKRELDAIAPSATAPYVTSFQINGQDISCTYKSRDENTFFSITGNQPHSRNIYIVKFTRRYSAEAHQFLASRGLAPKLWQHKEIPGEWTVVIMDKSEYVLLSYLKTHLEDSEELEKVQSKVMIALKEFHDQGFVHGDIRDINILVDLNSLASRHAEDVRIHFIDFDWAGKVGEVRYPIGVNTETVRRPDGITAGVLITKEHDETMAGYMFS